MQMKHLFIIIIAFIYFILSMNNGGGESKELIGLRIASNGDHTLYISESKDVYAWGYNKYGQLGDGGYEDRNNPAIVNDLYDVIDVATGLNCSYAVTADGSVWAWGNNDYGQLGDGSNLGSAKPAKVPNVDNVESIESFFMYYQTGDQFIYDENGEGTYNPDCMSFYSSQTVAIRKDGYAIAWGAFLDTVYGPTLATSWGKIDKIFENYVLLQDGTVKYAILPSGPLGNTYIGSPKAKDIRVSENMVYLRTTDDRWFEFGYSDEEPFICGFLDPSFDSVDLSSSAYFIISQNGDMYSWNGMKVTAASGIEYVLDVSESQSIAIDKFKNLFLVQGYNASLFASLDPKEINHQTGQ